MEERENEDTGCLSNEKIEVLVVNIKTITEEDWIRYLEHIIDRKERERILSFVFPQDRYRAMAFHPEIFQIERTREGKPFLVYDQSLNVGTWNFNVSHHGDYVGIISHKTFLVGTDIVDHSTRPGWIENFEEFLEIYQKQLAREEIEIIRSLQTDDLKYLHFYVTWALKESYVKAVGVGIGIDLTKIRFSITYSSEDSLYLPSSSGTAEMFFENQKKTEWRFDFFPLDHKHLMAVARGPTLEAKSSFRALAWGESQLVENLPQQSNIRNCTAVGSPKFVEIEEVLETITLRK